MEMNPVRAKLLVEARKYITGRVTRLKTRRGYIGFRERDLEKWQEWDGSTLIRWFVRQAQTKRQADRMKWKRRCR